MGAIKWETKQFMFKVSILVVDKMLPWHILSFKTVLFKQKDITIELVRIELLCVVSMVSLHISNLD